MKKKNKVLIFLLSGMMALTSLTGCGKDKGNEEIIEEIARNDFAGAYDRLSVIQNDILGICNVLEENNYIIMNGNPSNYWSDNGYFFLNLLPIYEEDMKYVSVFNEENDFSEIKAYVTDLLINDGIQEGDILVSKLGTNQYQVTYTGKFDNLLNGAYCNKTINVIYDAEKNRFKVSCYYEPFNNTYDEKWNLFFCEFAQVNKNVYVAQTESERLYIVYNDDKTVSEFYYTLIDPNEEINVNSLLVNNTKINLRDYGFNGMVRKIEGYEDLYVAYLQRGVIQYFMSYNNEDGALCVKPISLNNYALEKTISQPEYRKYFKKIKAQVYYDDEHELFLRYEDGHEIPLSLDSLLEEDVSSGDISTKTDNKEETDASKETAETSLEHSENIYEEVGDDGVTVYTYEVNKMVQFQKDVNSILATISEDGELLYEDGEIYKKIMVCRKYDQDENSIFSEINSITPEWTEEAKFFKKKLIYKNEELTIVSKNDLTGDITEFTIKVVTEVKTDEEQEEKAE